MRLKNTFLPSPSTITPLWDPTTFSYHRQLACHVSEDAAASQPQSSYAVITSKIASVSPNDVVTYGKHESIWVLLSHYIQKLSETQYWLVNFSSQESYSHM